MERKADKSPSPDGTSQKDNKKRDTSSCLHSLLGLIAMVVFAGSMLIFLAAAGSSAQLGGDAVSGYKQDGHFYVSSKGKVTEVTEEEWHQSLWLHRTMWDTFPLAIISLAYLMIWHIHPLLMHGDSRQRTDKAKQLAYDIAQSGPVIVDAKCSGEIGVMRSVWIAVSLHPAGLVVKSFPGRAFGIRLSDIRVIREYTSWWRRGIEITHRSKDALSGTLMLYGEEGKPLKAVLNRLMAEGENKV